MENLEKGYLGQEGSGREIIKDVTEDLLIDYSRSRNISFNEEKFMVEVFWSFLKIFSLNNPISLKAFMDRIERTVIASVLSRVNGNQKRAAKILDIRYTTLNEKVKRHRIRFKKHPF